MEVSVNKCLTKEVSFRFGLKAAFCRSQVKQQLGGQSSVGWHAVKRSVRRPTPTAGLIIAMEHRAIDALTINLN